MLLQKLGFVSPLVRYGWETPIEKSFLLDRVECVVFKSSFLEKRMQPLWLGITGMFLVVLDRLRIRVFRLQGNGCEYAKTDK